MGEKINWCCASVVAQQEGGAEEGLEGESGRVMAENGASVTSTRRWCLRGAGGWWQRWCVYGSAGGWC